MVGPGAEVAIVALPGGGFKLAPCKGNAGVNSAWILIPTLQLSSTTRTEPDLAIVVEGTGITIVTRPFKVSVIAVASLTQVFGAGVSIITIEGAVKYAGAIFAMVPQGAGVKIVTFSLGGLVDAESVATAEVKGADVVIVAIDVVKTLHTDTAQQVAAPRFDAVPIDLTGCCSNLQVAPAIKSILRQALAITLCIGTNGQHLVGNAGRRVGTAVSNICKRCEVGGRRGVARRKPKQNCGCDFAPE